MASDLRPGALFADRYRVLARLASGGTGSVYEAVHVATGRRCALKVLHAHVLHSDGMRARFEREARVTAAVECEFIVDVLDAGVDAAESAPYLVMELLRGEELGQRLERLGRLSPADVVTYVTQIASALDKAHAAGVVHRDLKPANLFLTQRDDGTPRIKIVDFGVAKLLAEDTAQAAQTHSLGTPLYMAPEQFDLAGQVTPACDVHALGMITYALLVGRPYWAEESRAGGNVFAFAAVASRGATEPALARARRAGVALPAAFDPWFARATAPDPAGRFARATDAARALPAALGVDAAVDAPPRPEPPARPSPRAFALVAALSVMFGAWLGLRGDDELAPAAPSATDPPAAPVASAVEPPAAPEAPSAASPASPAGASTGRAGEIVIVLGSARPEEGVDVAAPAGPAATSPRPPPAGPAPRPSRRAGPSKLYSQE